MLVTENIVQRVHEWLDRREEEPNLVPRLRRLWTVPAARVAPASPARSARRLLRRIALQPRPGM